MKKDSFEYSRANKIVTEVNGKEVVGDYIVRNGMVTVRAAEGQISTQVGASAEMTARMLLRELAQG